MLCRVLRWSYRHAQLALSCLVPFREPSTLLVVANAEALAVSIAIIVATVSSKLLHPLPPLSSSNPVTRDMSASSRLQSLHQSGGGYQHSRYCRSSATPPSTRCTTQSASDSSTTRTGTATCCSCCDILPLSVRHSIAAHTQHAASLPASTSYGRLWYLYLGLDRIRIHQPAADKLFAVMQRRLEGAVYRQRQQLCGARGV